MNTESTSSTPPPPPPPPPGSARKRGSRRFYRSPDERMLGGLCGGIAEYFDLDPNIVRAATVVFTVFTGIGFIAYPLLWFLIPIRGRHLSGPGAGPSNRRRHHASRSGLVTTLALVGLAVISLRIIDLFDWIPVGLVLIGAGIWLFNQDPTRPEPAGSPTEWAGPPTSRSAQSTPTFEPDLGVRRDPADMTDDELHAAAEWPDPTESDFGGPEPDPGAHGRRGHGGRRLGRLLVIAAALIAIPVAGLTALLAGSDIAITSDTMGVQHFAVTRLPDLNDEYRVAAGSLTLDLSELDMEGQHRSVDITVGAGEVYVVLPPDAGGGVSASVRAGEIVVDGFGAHDGAVEGLGKVTKDFRLDGDNGSLDISAQITIGAAEFVRGDHPR